MSVDFRFIRASPVDAMRAARADDYSACETIDAKAIEAAIGRVVGRVTVVGEDDEIEILSGGISVFPEQGHFTLCANLATLDDAFFDQIRALARSLSAVIFDVTHDRVLEA